MAYGMRVKNTAGNFQIDGQYKNYFLKEEGSNVSVSNGYNTGSPPIMHTGWETTINFLVAVSQLPLIAFRPSTNYYSTIANYNKSGSNFSGFCATCPIGQTTTIDWRLYLPIWVASTEQY